MGQTAAVELHVQPEPLGGVGHLHGPGDAAVLVRAGAHEVGAAVDDEVDVLLQAEDVLGLQQRSLEQLAQLAVGEDRHPAILIRILQPEEVLGVAGAAQAQGVGPGLVLTGRVDHQIHAVAHPFAHRVDVGHLASDRGIAPAVDLEGAIPQAVALLGEVGKRLGAAQAAVLVAVVRGGVRRNALAPAAQQPVDGRVVRLAGKVPQSHVHRTDGRAVRVAQTALQVVVDPLAGERIAAQQIRGHIAGHRPARIFTDDSLAGVDAHDTGPRPGDGAFFIDLVEAVVVGAQVVDLVLEEEVFDAGDGRFSHGIRLRMKGE